MAHGTCLFGFTCKFNHPVPAEQPQAFVDYSHLFPYEFMQGPMMPLYVLPAPSSSPPFLPVYPPQIWQQNQ